MPRFVLNSQSQRLLLNLMEYFTKERDNNGPLISLGAVQERVADALKISRGTIQRVVKKAEVAFATGSKLSTPRKKRPKRKQIQEKVDSFSRDAIRSQIYDMYLKHDHITLNALQIILKEKDIFSYSRSTLHKVLQQMGFKYKKDDNRHALCEKMYVVEQRLQFLRKYKSNKDNVNLDVVFLDETWIFARGSKRRSWQDGTTKTVKNQQGEGKRYIVLSAGGKNGFIPNSSLIFQSKSKTGDYHGEMTADNFNKWLQDQLLPSLEKPSLIVMDNAPYHTTLVEKLPALSWNKDELKNFLKSKNVHFEESMFKRELYGLAKDVRIQKQYVADQIIQSHGHTVLRLPPYHCQFNAIELVWSQSKRYFDNHIGRDGYGDEFVKAMWEESLQEVTPVQWSNYVAHAEKLIDESWERECRFDLEGIEPFIINIGESDSSDNEWNSDSEDLD